MYDMFALMQCFLSEQISSVRGPYLAVRIVSLSDRNRIASSVRHFWATCHPCLQSSKIGREDGNSTFVECIYQTTRHQNL